MDTAHHNRHSSLACAAVLAAFVFVIGCDRLTGAKSGAAAADDALIATDSAAPLPTSLKIESLATLTPGRSTLLAATPNGSIFAVQSAVDAGDRGGDVVKIDSGQPHPTALSAAAVLRALGMGGSGDAASAARGRFTAIAARGDDKLAFCFAGVAAARPFVAIGTFDPNAEANGQEPIFLPVDQIVLDAAGDPNVATDSARPSLFTAGDDAYLWRANEGEIRLLTITALSSMNPVVKPSTVQLTAVRDATTSEVERTAWEWSATSRRGEFLLTDTASRWIRRIDTAGTLTHVARFDAAAVPTLSAAAQDAAGRAIVFACDRDGIVQGLLVQDGASFKSILHGSFIASSPLDLDALRIDRLLPLPREVNGFVAYEATSGAIVRVRLK